MTQTNLHFTKSIRGGYFSLLLFTIVAFLTLTSESTPPYLWHKPQKSAETQSFSPLLSNLNQGNNDFQYVPVLNTVLNSPLEVDPEAYAVFSDGTLTFYYDNNKPSGAYGTDLCLSNRQ